MVAVAELERLQRPLRKRYQETRQVLQQSDSSERRFRVPGTVRYEGQLLRVVSG
ncbi:UNVERIFIED_CONTAM: hypothetical protein PYX00_000042 [Menopon gallinae]|uniref:Uncharacterized protein n=1 Tax=Menopon gallinae TaxID=328185 RepID=A0AAW2I7R0_9NEOP